MKAEQKVLTLGVDYARAFNYWAACEISDYIEENGYAPNAILIDATKDEENNSLHEIYGTLEQIKNGDMKAFFQGRRKRLYFPSGIPIYVFSNSAPLKRSLSDDCWKIRGLCIENENGWRDVSIQDCKVEIEILSTKKNLVSYRNNVTLLPMEEFENALSGDLQKKMYFQNIEEIVEFEKKINRINIVMCSFKVIK